MSDESDAADIEIEDGGGASEMAEETANGSSDVDSTASEETDKTETDETKMDETETDDTETDESAVDRLEEVDDELASEVHERLDALSAERDQARERAEELEGKLKRTRADFQNYKKRAKKRQQSIQDRATEDLVERLVPVRDNLQRALDQDEDADIREGVESTLTELDRVLEEENVEPIEPDPGEEVDPHRHEVLMRVDSDQPPETIAESYRPGYEMGDKVLREAQVTVSDGDAE